MKIVFRSHPDRNNSIEALSLFRNATYAYQILGKDDESRAKYDRRIDAQSYMDALEGVGSAIAMEVAVPLLNLTFQSMKTIAIPFFRDFFEQSSAVVMATMSAENSDTFEDIVSRASTAREKAAINQKLRNLQKTKQKLDYNLNQSITKLSNAVIAELEARDKAIEFAKNVAMETANIEKLERSVHHTCVVVFFYISFFFFLWFCYQLVYYFLYPLILVHL
jgi:DnaJ-class molecular chaperone